jgi:putative SOS response-associated peptidase YedK
MHDRMPVILEQRDFGTWLAGAENELMKPAANGVLQRWPVSKRVNSSRTPDDDPTLIDRIELASALPRPPDFVERATKFEDRS